MIIEGLWNQIIYSKFNNKVRINKNSIEKEIINYYNSKDKKYEYNLSEIVIDIEKDISSKKKEISEYIEQFGFKVAANKYSKSDTSKFGGKIGWIKYSTLTKKIKNKISTIKVGDITDPIQTSNGYLFLKLNNKREITEKFDLENELKQQIKYEKNRQLNQFSLIYYKKLKKIQMFMRINKIIIILGEPQSIFSEILFKYFNSKEFSKNKKKIILIGSMSLLQKQMKKLKFNLNLKLINNINDAKNNEINILNINYNNQKNFSKISSNSKKYISNCFEVGLGLIKNNKKTVLINGPVSKKHFLKKNTLA